MAENLTHGIKFKDKLGYALGDMGGIFTFRLSVLFKISFTPMFSISTRQKLLCLSWLQDCGMRLTTLFGVRLSILANPQSRVSSDRISFGFQFRLRLHAC